MLLQYLTQVKLIAEEQPQPLVMWVPCTFWGLELNLEPPGTTLAVKREDCLQLPLTLMKLAII